jgi:hypothetical protein
MASFENAILGDVKGKVGQVIGRRRGKKFFFYAAPREVKISNTPLAIKSRKKMKPVAQFASVVNSIPELKNLWKSSKIEAFDAFHKIEKLNYPFFTSERPTKENMIIPNIHTDNNITESSISGKGIKLKIFISIIEEPEFDGVKELAGIGVICYYNPIDKTMDYFHLSKIRTGTFNVKIDKQFEVEIPFSGGERNNYNSYLSCIIYFTFVAKDFTGIPVKYCCNYRNEFVHEIIGEKERFKVCDSRP